MYLDPTTGSLVMQVIAAGAISALAMVGRVRVAAKSIFQKAFRGRRWTGRR